MADTIIKEMTYDHSRILVECARRDGEGRTIKETYAEKTNTINGKAIGDDPYVTASDVGLGLVKNRGMDENPTQGSDNYVSSNGVYQAIKDITGETGGALYSVLIAIDKGTTKIRALGYASEPITKANMKEWFKNSWIHAYGVYSGSTVGAIRLLEGAYTVMTASASATNVYYDLVEDEDGIVTVTSTKLGG